MPHSCGWYSFSFSESLFKCTFVLHAQLAYKTVSGVNGPLVILDNVKVGEIRIEIHPLGSFFFLLPPTLLPFLLPSSYTLLISVPKVC